MPENALIPYSPVDDARLCLYVNALTTIATYLGINEGTKSDPRLGKYGLLGLSNPLTVRLTFPTRLQLVQYERLIVKETLASLTTQGKLATEETLYEKYGFLDDEVALVLRLAHQRASFLTKTDAEEDKSMMVLMLQDYIKRCREIGAQRNELAALKALAVVQSITKIEPESINTEFEALIEKLADEPRPPLKLPMD
jgi:hypothetical protein